MDFGCNAQGSQRGSLRFVNTQLAMLRPLQSGLNFPPNLILDTKVLDLSPKAQN